MDKSQPNKPARKIIRARKVRLKRKMLLTKRCRDEYDIDDKEIILQDIETALSQIKGLKLRQRKSSGRDIVFENHKINSGKINTALADITILITMLLAKTQSGKTGAMSATIKQYLENNIIPLENIYVITGLSSTEWKQQTKERLPEIIRPRVFHRDDLLKGFAKDIKNKKNVLIIIDEIQVAAKYKQTIYKALKKLGFLDKQFLYKNDIKIIEFTATPDGSLGNLMKWDNGVKKILGVSGHGYIGSTDLLQQGRVIQNKDLCGYDKHGVLKNDKVFEHINEIKDVVIREYKHPMYHIIRTKNGYYQELTKNNFKKVFPEDKYGYILYDGENKPEDENGEIQGINYILNTKPTEHTFIFIKEMIRCAKTLDKKYIGILYERYVKNPDDSSVIQGLIGRNTGYDVTEQSICFTNIDSVIRYGKIWDSDFDDTSIKWNSKTTKFKNGVILPGNTFNNPTHYDDSCENVTESHIPVIKIFKTQKEAKDYYNRVLKVKLGGRRTGPRNRTPREDGYYYNTIRTRTDVFSCEEVKKEQKWGLKVGYRLHTCYEDTNNKDTLQWWIIHY